jgi:hypothetical protein
LQRFKGDLGQPQQAGGSRVFEDREASRGEKTENDDAVDGSREESVRTLPKSDEEDAFDCVKKEIFKISN